MATDDSLAQLSARLKDFSARRDWQRYHSPKNLAMAVAGECGELLAELQWLTEDQSRAPGEDRLARIRDEAADVLIYLTQLARVLEFDLVAAANAKMDRNEGRFPVGAGPSGG